MYNLGNSVVGWNHCGLVFKKSSPAVASFKSFDYAMFDSGSIWHYIIANLVDVVLVTYCFINSTSTIFTNVHLVALCNPDNKGAKESTRLLAENKKGEIYVFLFSKDRGNLLYYKRYRAFLHWVYHY